MSRPVTSNVVDGIQEAHDEGGDDDVDDDDDDGDRYIRETTFSYYFDSVAELVDWVKKTGREHGCVISVQRSRERSVELVCNRGGEPKLKATMRHTGSIKRGCLFKLVGRYNAPGGSWKLEVVNETHNHHHVLFEDGHPTLRKLTDEEIDMVATLHRHGLRAAQIKSSIKKSFPGNKCITRDIYNIVKLIDDQDKIGETPMQVLENFLQTHGFTFYTWENPSTNRTENVFFCHEKSHIMWRAFPDLLLIDTTYNTNMEQECNFTWALERLKDMLVDCREPRVILTDKDQALMKSCETVFPNAIKNFCRWHIMQTIQRKHKSLFQTDIFESFNYWWKVLYDSPTKAMFDYNCGQIEAMLAGHGRREAWYYIRDNWLVPYKEKFVSCWIDDRLNFGEHTTNRVEGQHANLKRYLPGPNNSLDSIVAFALEVVNSQMEEINATLENSRVRIKKYHKLTLFEKLHKWVLLFSIAKLDKELTLLDTLQDTAVECDHRLQTSWGFPCACKINWYTIHNIRIPLKDIDPFWRKLDFSPASIRHEEPDYEAELEDVKKQVLGLNNRIQKKVYSQR
ncbi:PKS-NRPS hybrid synthetase cheA-like [Bidens hawaiensis]|uniref:PKS-NRPS hybrid synthetase cheA-like n=1 Tax=Bidens hawaiensis TaxID=980011 RepID=UPI00404B8089